MYRRINKIVAELLWLELIWLIDWWAGVKVMDFFLRTVYTFAYLYASFSHIFTLHPRCLYIVHINDMFFEVVILFGSRHGSKIVMIK
jgi:hypothetical protein